MMVDDLGRIPMSQHLAATLTRAASYADAQAHPEVTLEHLLLALAEDPDAAGVLLSSNVDLARLAGEVSTHIGQIEDRRSADAPSQVMISPDLKRILEAAAAAARQGRRAEINGAIVLAAIVGDGKSTAAHLLRAQGLTFEQAIRALQRSAARPEQPASPPAPAPAPMSNAPSAGLSPSSTEDILASTRERVQSRSTQYKSPPQREPALPASPQAPSGPPAGPPADQVMTETTTVARPDPRLNMPPPGSSTGRSPLEPQWETAGGPPPRPAQPPPQDVPPTRPPQRTGPPPQPSPPPFQAPPSQRTQPPTGLPPRAPAPGPRTGPPPLNGPPPPLNQPSGRTAPPSQMRPPQPGPPPGGPSGPGGPPAPRQRAGAPGNVRVAAGQLVENIPRRMRVGIPLVVEARVARAEVKAIAEGLQGGGAVYRHEVTVTKAMSVRLRAPDGGFYIETSSPETQWIENVLGLMSDDFASWRWTVTPSERGKRKLQLLISARTVGTDGLTAETALPDQVIEVKVGVNYARTAVRWAGWMTAAVIGGVLARFGEGLLEPLISIIRKVGGA